MVTDSASSSTVGATFKTTPVPVVVSEAFILDDMGMVDTGSSNSGSTSAQTQVTVTTAGSGHPLGANIPPGTITTSTGGVTHGWGKPAAAAQKVATLPSESTKATLFSYDTGDTMRARRVSWPIYEGASSLLNANTAALFTATIEWAADLPSTPSAVVVVGDPAGLTTRDTWIRDRLVDAGWDVTLVDDNAATASSADGHQLVVISESVSGSTVGATFANVVVPVIVAETYILDDMGMVGTASSEYGTTGADQTQVAVTTVGSTHPLGAGLVVGNTTTSTAGVTHGWGKPAAAAVIATTLPTDATKATIFGYDTGAAMSSGSAPARRVGWFHYAGAASNLNATATGLFDAAVTWAAQATPVIRYTRDATDQIVQRNVNNRTVARYSYTASGDTSDLTLDSPNPIDWDHVEQSEKSNCASSPGGVSIGTDAPSARRKRGPRSSRTQRTTVGYDPVNPSAETISKSDFANSFGFPTSNDVSRSAHTGSITRSFSPTVRAGGGPPFFTHAEIVSG